MEFRFSELVGLFFFSLIIKERKWMINRAEKKIAKLRSKLDFQERFYESMLRETKDMIEKYNRKEV